MIARTRTTIVSACAALATVFGGQAGAALCTIDDVPGATVLYPYFQVNLDDCDAPGPLSDTVITVSNAAGEPTLTNLTVWTNADRVITGFNVYLNAYGSAEISMRDLVCDGVFPDTDPANRPESNLVPPPTGLPPACDGGQLSRPPLSPAGLTAVQEGLTGQPVAAFGGQFVSISQGDNVARGFVTIDAVVACGLIRPVDVGYFVDGGVGIATNDNHLTGTWEITDQTNNFAFGARAPALEADNDFVFMPGDPTFYGRFNFMLGEDDREPLPSRFFVRRNDAASSETMFIVWRESGGSTSSSNDPSFPSDYPLVANAMEQFDTVGNPVPMPIFTPPDPAPMQRAPEYATQFVESQTLGYGAETDEGMVFMDTETFFTTLGQLIGQAWVVAVDSSSGIYSTAYPATALNSRCSMGRQFSVQPQLPLEAAPNDSLVFFDSFEL